MTSTTHSPFAEAVVAFGRRLKESGFAVSPPTVMDALEGVRRVGMENPQVFKTVLKAIFMTRVEETPTFERLFAEFWLDRRDVEGETGPGQGEEGDSADDEQTASGEMGFIAESGEADSQGDEAAVPQPCVIYSPQEVLRKRDFKNLPDGHDDLVTQLIREIVAPLARRSAFRKRPATSGVTVDFRRLLRRSSAHGGEILELPRLKPRVRIKKIVFLCDVSGSMNPYLMFILRFIKELHALPTRVETFVFATRLHRITPLLARLPFHQALEQISDSVADWSGGTRIGSCLTEFTTRHGGEMLRPSTVVLIHSDGWDRGDPELLSRAMATIRRRAYRVIWINPLLGGPSYEPTCRGMKAALPFLDSFLPGHNLAGLEQVAGTLRAVL